MLDAARACSPHAAAATVRARCSPAEHTAVPGYRSRRTATRSFPHARIAPVAADAARPRPCPIHTTNPGTSARKIPGPEGVRTATPSNRTAGCHRPARTAANRKSNAEAPPRSCAACPPAATPPAPRGRRRRPPAPRCAGRSPPFRPRAAPRPARPQGSAPHGSSRRSPPRRRGTDGSRPTAQGPGRAPD